MRGADIRHRFRATAVVPKQLASARVHCGEAAAFRPCWITQPAFGAIDRSALLDSDGRPFDCPQARNSSTVFTEWTFQR